MADRAQVKSVESIAAFRTSLIIYISKARAALEEAGASPRDTGAWLQTNQQPYWDREFHRRQRVLEEAQQALFSAKLSHIQTQTAAQVLAVERAKIRLREAEEKRASLGRWRRELENRADPLARHIDQLHTFLTTDLTKAVAFLHHIVSTLDDYAALAPASPRVAELQSPAPLPENCPATLEGAAEPAGRTVSVPPETPGAS